MPASQAHEHSRDFEILLRRIFEFEFQLAKDEIIITQMTRDGGKDLEFVINKIRNALQEFEDKVWVEAKLRGRKRKNSKVQLNEIAGNIIIATNSNVHSIYFVTSTYFSEQTIIELYLLKLRTGLRITLVDGVHMRTLIEKWRGKLTKHQELITYLYSILPIEPDKTIENIFVYIDRESNQIRVEKKTRQNQKSRKKNKNEIGLSLSQKEYTEKGELVVDSVDMEKADFTPTGRILGSARVALFNELTRIGNQIVILKGCHGQGKSFLLSWIHAHYQNQEYVTHRINIRESDHIVSFTRQFILKVANLDYSHLIEEEHVIDLLSLSFNLDKKVIHEIILLLTGKPNFSAITADVCTLFISQLIKNCHTRKNFVLLVDDLDHARNDLFPFLLNLFEKLKGYGVTVVATFCREKERTTFSVQYDNTTQHTYLQSRNFISRQLPTFAGEDVEELIREFLPGANDNIVNLVKERTLQTPLHIKVLTDHIVNQGVIETEDGEYSILNPAKTDLIQLPVLDTLYQDTLEKCMEDRLLRKLAVIVYLFNNWLEGSWMYQLIPELEESRLFDVLLFKKVYQEDTFYLTFIHPLLCDSLDEYLPNKMMELSTEAGHILKTLPDSCLPGDVTGNLYKYTGNREKAYEDYLQFAGSLCNKDDYKALEYYEKAIEQFPFSDRKSKDMDEHRIELCELIFDIFKIYGRHNILYKTSAQKYYSILQRYNDQEVLSEKHQLLYYYYLGQRETKLENYSEAHNWFKQALEILEAWQEKEEEWIIKVNHAYAIDLKHLGLRQKSVTFFEDLTSRWDFIKFECEKYSNLAAFYLTTDPQLSLEYYEKMKDIGQTGFHLEVDFAMAYFYLGQYDTALKILNELIPRIKDAVNLSEEARAENIRGLVYWKKKKYRKAEACLGRANSVAELSNNHRSMWRIRINLAQIAALNGKPKKAYNLCHYLIEHFRKNEQSILRELEYKEMCPKRIAVLKAICLVLHKVGQPEDIAGKMCRKLSGLKEEIHSFHQKIEDPVTYTDASDSNFCMIEKAYLIL